MNVTGGELDPFRVIGRIPKGRVYQWVAESVVGDKEIARAQFASMTAAGWRPVPASRHRKMRHRGRRVVVGGQVLMENSAVNAEVARAAEMAAARKMFDEHPANGLRRPHEGFPSTFAVVQGSYPPSIVAPLTVDVTIAFKLPPNLVDTAAICGLSAPEYARRMLALILRGDIPGGLFPTLERDAYEVRDLTTKEKRT